MNATRLFDRDIPVLGYLVESAVLRQGQKSHESIGGIREYRVWSMEYRESQKDMVTGDGHGHREFRSRLFGHRELAPGFRRLKAERLTPERLTTVAVTRHLSIGY